MKGYIIPPGFDTQPLRRIGLLRFISAFLLGVLPALGLDLVRRYSDLQTEEILTHPVTLSFFVSIWILGTIVDRFVVQPLVTDLAPTPAHWTAMPFHVVLYCLGLFVILIYAGSMAVGFTVVGTLVGISFGKHWS